MMEIKATQVKELREMTGVAMGGSEEPTSL